MDEYEVIINGLPHTMLLDEKTAKEMKGKRVEAKASPAPANKARTASNKKG